VTRTNKQQQQTNKQTNKQQTEEQSDKVTKRCVMTSNPQLVDGRHARTAWQDSTHARIVLHVHGLGDRFKTFRTEVVARQIQKLDGTVLLETTRDGATT